jgi:hypothetical protein
LSSNAGVPIGRRPPSSFSLHPRSTGAAWALPLRRRSWKSRRGAVYLGAVTPSIPAALDLLVRHYASRRQSSSIRWANVVNPRAGSRAACAALRWSCGVTVGALQVSPVFLPSTTCGPASPALPGVRWACVPHLPRYDAPLRQPLCPSRDPALGARAPIPCLFLSVRGGPHGLVLWSKLPNPARAFGHPVPPSGHVTRRQMALPRSRATPVKTCPALRPRWCPAYSPSRTQDGDLPATGNRRRSSLYGLESYPVVHDSTLCGARSRGLPPPSIPLRTSMAGCARGCHC